ncbi:unnamed protein product [Brassica napus]|uniref:(rape) hypothetical protein n=1 Tax=Brassica napus TaxID=3708 RepID=A0A816SAZ3_BRANA|nr:unnamed protein product [Brassica napus]
MMAILFMFKPNLVEKVQSFWIFPLPYVFKRLYEGVGYIPSRAVPSPANQGNLITPCIPTNSSKCFKSMDCGTGQASTADKSNVRKRPRTDFQFPTNIFNFMDRLEEDFIPDTFQCEMIGDTSEEDANPSAYDSDYAYRFDENFQADLDCSSKENTDSDSNPEIEVLDSTVTTQPDNAFNRGRIKFLASLFEEAFQRCHGGEKNSSCSTESFRRWSSEAVPYQLPAALKLVASSVILSVRKLQRFLLTAAALSIVWQRMWRRLGFEGALSVFGVAMVGGVMCCRRARVRFPFRGGSELLLLLVVSWFFLRLRVECDGGRARLFFSSSPVVTRWRSPAFVTPVFCLQVDSCCLLLPIKALVEACYWVRSWVLAVAVAVVGVCGCGRFRFLAVLRDLYDWYCG